MLCPSDAKLLLGHLPAAFVGGTLAVGGLGTLLWGPWKGVKEVSPDPGGRTGNWGVVASSHAPIPRASQPAALRDLRPPHPRHTRGS